MLILIDAGNTRLKWAAWGDGRWQARGALANHELDALPERLANFRPAWIGVSCVAGVAVREYIETYARRCGIAPYWLRPVAELHGMVNSYRAPETLGADRFAALFACHCRGLAPCIMVMAGTALTIDALASEGVFQGGMILPGARLMRQSLASGTAGLAESPGVCQDFPRATPDAIETGLCAAQAGAVRALHERLVRLEGRDVATLVSGGDAEWLASHLPGEVRIVENMVLEGLLCLAKHLGVQGA
jgi:type III pantothenate kinase